MPMGGQRAGQPDYSIVKAVPGRQEKRGIALKGTHCAFR